MLILAILSSTMNEKLFLRLDYFTTLKTDEEQFLKKSRKHDRKKLLPKFHHYDIYKIKKVRQPCILKPIEVFVVDVNFKNSSDSGL